VREQVAEREPREEHDAQRPLGSHGSLRACQGRRRL
jgi:hypothetical protein